MVRTQFDIYPKVVGTFEVDDPAQLEAMRQALCLALDAYIPTLKNTIKTKFKTFAANNPGVTLVGLHYHRLSGSVDEVL